MEILNAIYDFQRNPASYDFLVFLGAADKYREAHGMDRMDVYFIPGEQSFYYDNYYPKNFSEREGLFWRVCVPSCRLVKSVRNVHVFGDRNPVGGRTYPENWATTRPEQSHGCVMFKSANRCFNASDQAKLWVQQRYHDYFTITLRECTYGEKRNSDRKEWLGIAAHIKGEGNNVVIVPDTYGQGFAGYENCVPASWDVDIRLALYQGAKLNLGGANGPMSFCLLSNAKVMMIDTEVSDFNPSPNIFEARMPVRELIPRLGSFMSVAA